MGEQLKTPDFNSGIIQTKNRKYFVHSKISFNRFQRAQELMIEGAFGSSFPEIFLNIRKAYDYLNTSTPKPVDAGILLYNVMNGITVLEKKQNPALMLAALYINYEGEDVTQCNDAALQEKIEDWGREFDITPFYSLGINLINGLIPVYEFASKNFSEKVEPTPEKNSSKKW